LLSLLAERGIRITHSYQLNVGGNTDFENMCDPDRSAHKVRTKLASLTHLAGARDTPVTAGPNGCVPELRDFKVGHIHIEGTGLLGMPLSVELRLSVEDSPNAAAVAVTATRAARAGRDRGLPGPLDPVCAALSKTPPRPMEDAEARSAFDEFVADGPTRSEPGAEG